MLTVLDKEEAGITARPESVPTVEKFPLIFGSVNMLDKRRLVKVRRVVFGIKTSTEIEGETILQ